MADDPMQSLSPANRAALTAELRPDEVLQWASEPSNGMRAAGCIYLTVAVPALGFGLLWLLMSGVPAAWDLLHGRSQPWAMYLFPLFGVPFVVIGTAALLKPYAVWAEARATVYAFTDRRLLRLVHRRGRSLSTVPLERVGGVEVQSYSDGSGVLTIQTYGPATGDGPAPVTVYTLLGVRDVERAYQLLMARPEP